jgi:hypothetical protein
VVVVATELLGFYFKNLKAIHLFTEKCNSDTIEKPSYSELQSTPERSIYEIAG